MVYRLKLYVVLILLLTTIRVNINWVASSSSLDLKVQSNGIRFPHIFAVSQRAGAYDESNVTLSSTLLHEDILLDGGVWRMHGIEWSEWQRACVKE